MKNRISQRLIHHQNELRKRALKEKDEKLRKDYWWLYYNAKDIEPEIREMVLKAENRSMLERIIESGLIHILLEEEKDNPSPEEDIPPRQMGLWD